MSEPVSPSSTTGSGTKPRRGLKLPPGVAVVLVLLCVAGGGWFVWDQLRTPDRADLSEYEPLNAGSARQRQRLLNNGGNPQAPVRVIAQPLFVSRPDGGGDVRVDGIRARFEKAGDSIKASVEFVDTAFQPQPDRFAIQARFRAISNADEAKAAGVSDDQVKQLRGIKYTREMILPDATRTALVDQWQTYRVAGEDQKKALEQPIVDLLRKAAAEGQAPTLAFVKTTADQVRSVLTQQQIDTLRVRRAG